MLPASEIARLREKTIRLSTWNSRFILIFAILGAFIALPFDPVSGILIGIFGVVAGLVEIRGLSFLKVADRRAVLWMPASQVWLLLVIVGSCVWQAYQPGLGGIDLPIITAVIEPEVLHWLNSLFCVLVALVSLFYQGGLAWLYYRRCDLLTAPWRQAD